MTIYTTAARVARHNVCEGGQERTRLALEKEGKTMDTRVTMQNILRSLGLTDALYSFAEVEPESEDEAGKVLREYMRNLAGYTSTMIMVTEPGLGAILADANKVINKRCDGHWRAELARKAYVALSRTRTARTNPALRYWLQAYIILVSPKPDYIAATHATVSFIDGCRAVQMAEDAKEKMSGVLAALLGPEPEPARALPGMEQEVRSTHGGDER